MRKQILSNVARQLLFVIECQIQSIAVLQNFEVIYWNFRLRRHIILYLSFGLSKKCVILNHSSCHILCTFTLPSQIV